MSLLFQSVLTYGEARINARTSNGVIWGLEVVLGIGTGAFSQAGFAIAQAMVDPGEIQSAISFMLIGWSSWLSVHTSR
jgi:predicted MFS family arabinose efflux permease